MFRTSLAVDTVEQIWIGLSTPVRIGPITVASPISCINLTEMLAECRAGDTRLNERMVEDGWALSYGRFAAAEDRAERKRRGLWRGTFQSPRDFRDGLPPESPRRWYEFWK